MPDSAQIQNSGSFDSSDFVRQTIEKLRARLLDLTLRNPLISFKHSDRSRRHVRVIDELPDQLDNRLRAEGVMRFKSLGAESSEPDEEKTILFRRALDAARLEEDEYRQQLEALGVDPGERAIEELDHQLRIRLRQRLGMPPRKAAKSITAQDVARKRGLDPSFDLPASPPEQSAEPDKKHSDQWIQTLLFDEPLERTLSRIREYVRLSIDEAGVNPLFCVFGFLEWYEDANSTTPIHAPLLLYPLHIDYEIVRGRHQHAIRSTGDPPFANVALFERLKRDFAIELPAFDEEADTPERYFTKVQGVIQNHRSWKVRRWVTVGLFSFSKIAMYQDLDPERWELDGGLQGHIPLARIIGGGNNSAAFDEVNDHDQPRGDSSELDLPLIADADHSQLEAVRSVAQGRGVVIEGPPGTGKSQTITNIIATALAAGKTVLFLAEKMAALNVVKDRLAEANLDQFCLELHSTKSSRKEVFASLSRRLAGKRARCVDADLQSTLTRLETARRRLRDLVEALAQPAGNLGVTTQELLWTCQRLREATPHVPSDIDGLLMPEAEQMTKVDLGRVVSTADQLSHVRSQVIRSYGSTRGSPWFGVAHRDIHPILAGDTVRLVGKLADAADRAGRSLTNITALTGVTGKTVESLRSVASAASIEPPLSPADDSLIARMATPQVLACMETFVRELVEHATLADQIAQSFASPEAASACSPDMIASLDRAASEGGIEQLTVAEVSAAVRHREKQADAARKFAALTTKASAAAGFDGSLTPAAENMLISAAELAAEAESLPPGARHPAVLMGGAHLVLSQAIARAADLRSRRDTLAAEFSLESSPDIQTLRQHATALRAAPFIPIFSARWRGARRAFKGMSRIARKCNRIQAAASMEMIAELKSGVASFASNEAIAKCAGPGFAGIDSDLSGALQGAGWADRVRSRLPAGGETVRRLTVFLFSAPNEQIAALAGIARDPQFLGLKQALAAPPERSHSLSEHSQEAARRADACVQTQKLLSQLRLRSDFQLTGAQPLLRVLGQLHALRDSLDHSETASTTLGSSFKGAATDPEPIAASAQFVSSAYDQCENQELRGWILAANARQRLQSLMPLANEAATAFTGVDELLAALANLVPVDFRAWLGVESGLLTHPAELRDHARRCAADEEGLHLLIDDARCLHEAREAGLGPLVTLLESHRVSLDDLGGAARRLIHQSIARVIISNSPSLANFTGDRHEALRREFRELDHQLKRLRQQKIAYDLLQRRIDPGSATGPRKLWTGRAVVENEAAKQQRHISTRDLLDRAGKAVQQLTPCFMMSPLSVAQFLTPGRLKFDLIVMDEASQLRPQDTIGAIARGSQIVIVGDPKQLPPTNFFMGANGAADDDEDGSAATEESVLDQAIAITRPHRLKWHYRSRHPSLIAFSNKEFYGNDPLILFPSPYHDRADFGLSYVHVPDGKFSGRVNVPEAQQIAAAVLEYAAAHPDRSIGVVSFNQHQADLIVLEIERLASDNPTFEAWRQKWEGTLERFFVKNLENVQGDERDVVFISTVYGQKGTFAQRFGPINNEGGHRRLNVLFTRSKYQMIVYSSMDPADIRVDEHSKWGVRALKGFLRFAKDGLLDGVTLTDRPPDSDFEIAVADALKEHGFEVQPQVGVAGYFIDIGVRNPNSPGEFVLGIECDGAVYHSAKNVRDRDRLRQEVLERLGWRIHRIWSLDWYRNAARERQRLIEAVAQAIAGESGDPDSANGPLGAAPPAAI
jgi:very-short-patch-repair endonuclease